MRGQLWLAAKRLILPLAIGAPCGEITCCWPEERLGRDWPDMETPTWGGRGQLADTISAHLGGEGERPSGGRAACGRMGVCVVHVAGVVRHLLTGLGHS